MPGQQKFVGLDVGGTTMKAAVVDDAGKPLSAPAVLDTRPELGQDLGLETMCEAIRRAIAAAKLQMKDVAAIGVATPGLMDIKGGLILDPPNLKPWKNVPFARIEKAFGKPTAFKTTPTPPLMANSGSVRLRALRAWYCSLRDWCWRRNYLMRRVVEGEHSHGGELGHLHRHARSRPPLQVRLRVSRSVCQRDQRRETREEMAAWRGTTKLHEYFTANDDDFTAKVVFDLADAGDELAAKIVDDTAYYVALGACAVLVTADPQMIVFGGGMAEAGEPFRAKIEMYVKKFGLPFPAKSVKIALAKLGWDAGFIGAAGCARMLVQKK